MPSTSVILSGTGTDDDPYVVLSGTGVELGTLAVTSLPTGNVVSFDDQYTQTELSNLAIASTTTGGAVTFNAVDSGGEATDLTFSIIDPAAPANDVGTPVTVFVSVVSPSVVFTQYRGSIISGAGTSADPYAVHEGTPLNLGTIKVHNAAPGVTYTIVADNGVTLVDTAAAGVKLVKASGWAFDAATAANNSKAVAFSDSANSLTQTVTFQVRQLNGVALDANGAAAASATAAPVFTVVSGVSSRLPNLGTTSKPMTKHIQVFGLMIHASATVSDADLLHTADVAAAYLDGNMDGTPDNLKVNQVLWDRRASMVLFSTNTENVEYSEAAGGAWNAYSLQNLWSSEIHAPADAASGPYTSSALSSKFDITLEEVLHIITHEGYANAHPGEFGESALGQGQGSTLALAMDAARGGYLEVTPSDLSGYPAGASYTYTDTSADYGTQVTEFIYWSLTSLLGGQDFGNGGDEPRGDGIKAEWKLNTAAKRILPNNIWTFHGLRPANRPERRLALAAHWLAKRDFTAWLDDWICQPPKNPSPAAALLCHLAVSDDYWSRHWTFRSGRFAAAQPLLGPGRLHDIAVNIILPWLHARATADGNDGLAARVEQRYYAWPKGQDNSRLKFVRQRLFGERRIPLRGAALQQGLLQVQADFCNQTNAVCDDCVFPDLVRRYSLEKT